MLKGNGQMGFSVSSAKWMVAALGGGVLAVPLAVAFANPAVTAPELQGAATAEAAAPAADALTAGQVTQGRGLFNSWSCGACHVLTDANGHGHIGPSLDGNATLSKEFVADRITNGQGAMPGFGGQLSPEEIDLLAAYVVAVKK